MLSVIYRVWLQFNSIRRKQFIYISILAIIVSLLEVVSIGAVLPFIAALTTPEELFAWPEVQMLAEYFEINSPDELLMPMTFLFILLTIFSSMFKVLLLWSQTRFSFSVGVELSNKMYAKALSRPYLISIKQNSNKTVSDIMLKAEMFVDGLILPVMIIIGAIFLLAIMMIFVIILDPYIAIYGVLGFASLYMLISLGIKKRLEKYSVNILKGQDEVFIILREGFGSIRDVILDKLQGVYSKKFLRAYTLLRRNRANVVIVGSIPKYLIESIGMVIIAILAFKMTTRGVDRSFILPVLGGLALSAQRILPVLQRSFASWTSIKGSYMPIVDALELLEGLDYDEKYKSKAEFNTNTFSFDQAIKLENITFSYNNTKTLDNINLQINKGECVAFIGETGCGKSTLLDIVMGLLDPNKGNLLVDGRNIVGVNKSEWQSQISHVPQTIFLLDKTIAENIAIGISAKDIDLDRVIKVSHDARISDFINSLSDGYNTIVGEDGCELSGGQKQRIGIARALYKKSKLIVLDEATSALDSKTEGEVLDAILKNKERTVLMITHRSEILHKCDRVIRMKNGSIEERD
jgi:ATP-binding cassette, subfamily B, bacterial PglK